MYNNKNGVTSTWGNKNVIPDFKRYWETKNKFDIKKGIAAAAAAALKPNVGLVYYSLK